MAIYGLAESNALINEVEKFQIGRYIYSDEAIGRILLFDIHERFPGVMYLSVPLEK
ncbi:hypothetical protein TNCT_155531, partial [Trichonephila clavata]